MILRTTDWAFVAAFALMLSQATLPAGAQVTRVMTPNTAPGIIGEPHPNHRYRVPSARCFPGIYDYKYGQFVFCPNRPLISTDDFFNGSALRPVNLDYWYGNAYDGM